MLECPVCLNSLLEAAGVLEKPCTNPLCSPAQLCGHCLAGVSKGHSGRKSKTVNRTFTASSSLTDTSVTPCGHVFHSRCLKDWMKETVGKPTCPNCRKPFTQARVVQVYLDGSHGGGQEPVPASTAVGGTRPCSSGSGSGCGASSTNFNIAAMVAPLPIPAPVPGPSQQQHQNANLLKLSNNLVIHQPPGLGLGNPEDLNPAVYDGGSLPDLKMIHNTLISDFNDLKTKYLELREEDDFRKGQLMSYEDDNLKLKAELQKFQLSPLNHLQYHQAGSRSMIPLLGMMNSHSFQNYPAPSHSQYPVPILLRTEMLPPQPTKRSNVNSHAHSNDETSSQTKRLKIVEPSQPQPPQPAYQLDYPMPTYHLTQSSSSSMMLASNPFQPLSTPVPAQGQGQFQFTNSTTTASANTQ